MELVLVIAAFQSILLALLLLTKRLRCNSDIILATYLSVSAVTILLAYLEIVNRKNGYPYPFLISSSVPPILLIGPLLWLYIKSLTTQQFRFKPAYLLLSLPFILVFALVAARHYFQPDDHKITIDASEQFRHDIIFPLIIGMIATSNIGYTIWGIALIKRYREMIKSFFSRIDTIDLRWLHFFLISSLISYATISILYIADALFEMMSYESLQIFGYSIVSTFIIILGFFGLKQGNVFTSDSISIDIERTLSIPDDKSPLASEEETFVRKLLSYMKESKPFLNPDITLSSLSDELSISPDYLSGVINGRLNMNFFDFVNHHRIEEFKSLCKLPQNKSLTLIGLAYNSGFNSKATFNRVFKKVVGSTPSEYYNKFSNNAGV